MPPDWRAAFSSHLPALQCGVPATTFTETACQVILSPLAFSELSALLQILVAFHEKLRDYKNTVYNRKVETGKRNEYSLKYRGEDVTEGILKTSGLFAFSAARLHVARDQLLCHYPHCILDFSLETGVYGLLNLLKISRHSQPSIIIATTIVIFIGHLLHCIISQSSKTMPERSSLTRQSGSQTRALGKDEV